MFRLYKNCNYRYTYEPRYVRSMSWKGTIMSVFCFVFSKYVWTVLLSLNEVPGLVLAAVALLYFADSLYIDYIFCKYTYFGKYQNIDKQARAGDWLSSIYFADSVLVLVGSLFALFLFYCFWARWVVKVCFLILLCIAILLVIPIFQVTSKKTTLLWCILRVVLYGTAQRTGFIGALLMGLCEL